MGYIESNLLPDEKIVYKARLHWIIFWKPFALIVLGIVRQSLASPIRESLSRSGFSVGER